MLDALLRVPAELISFWGTLTVKGVTGLGSAYKVYSLFAPGTYTSLVWSGLVVVVLHWATNRKTWALPL